MGNEVRIVGSLQFYEGGGTWQVADLEYRAMKPDDPNNIQKLSDGHKAAFVLTDPQRFCNGTVDVVVDDQVVTRPYAEMVMSTSIRMEGLVVKSVYTTPGDESPSKGAMTLTCELDGITVEIRTEVLRDANGNLITQDAYLGKTIDVNGIVDAYSGSYQIRVFSANSITVH